MNVASYCPLLLRTTVECRLALHRLLLQSLLGEFLGCSTAGSKLIFICHINADVLRVNRLNIEARCFFPDDLSICEHSSYQLLLPLRLLLIHLYRFFERCFFKQLSVLPEFPHHLSDNLPVDDLQHFFYRSILADLSHDLHKPS